MAVYGPVCHLKHYMNLSFASVHILLCGWQYRPYTAIWPSVPWTICIILHVTTFLQLKLNALNDFVEDINGKRGYWVIWMKFWEKQFFDILIKSEILNNRLLRYWFHFILFIREDHHCLKYIDSRGNISRNPDPVR